MPQIFEITIKRCLTRGLVLQINIDLSPETGDSDIPQTPYQSVSGSNSMPSWIDLDKVVNLGLGAPVLIKDDFPLLQVSHVAS